MVDEDKEGWRSRDLVTKRRIPEKDSPARLWGSLDPGEVLDLVPVIYTYYHRNVSDVSVVGQFCCSVTSVYSILYSVSFLLHFVQCNYFPYSLPLFSHPLRADRTEQGERMSFSIFEKDGRWC